MGRIDLKVVLLGNGYAGKTSLHERFIRGRFNTGLPYQNTIGGAFAAKAIDTPQAKDGKLIIGLWDTAGSERYEAMARIYYRDAKAAIICFDLTCKESWSRAKFWISEVRSIEGDACKLYLVGTKLDLIEDELNSRVVTESEMLQFATNMGARSFETSSKTGDNINELFKVIAEDFMDSPENRSQVEQNIRLNEKTKPKSCCF